MTITSILLLIRTAVAITVTEIAAWAPCLISVMTPRMPTVPVVTIVIVMIIIVMNVIIVAVEMIIVVTVIAAVVTVIAAVTVIMTATVTHLKISLKIPLNMAIKEAV